jgi:hypothetical protein
VTATSPETPARSGTSSSGEGRGGGGGDGGAAQAASVARRTSARLTAAAARAAGVRSPAREDEDPAGALLDVAAGHAREDVDRLAPGDVPQRDRDRLLHVRVDEDVPAHLPADELHDVREVEVVDVDVDAPPRVAPGHGNDEDGHPVLGDDRGRAEPARDVDDRLHDGDVAERDVDAAHDLRRDADPDACLRGDELEERARVGLPQVERHARRPAHEQRAARELLDAAAPLAREQVDRIAPGDVAQRERHALAHVARDQDRGPHLAPDAVEDRRQLLVLGEHGHAAGRRLRAGGEAQKEQQRATHVLMTERRARDEVSGGTSPARGTRSARAGRSASRGTAPSA